MQGGELAFVAAFLSPFLQFGCTHLGEQFLGLDERHLHIAVGVAVERQLMGHSLGQRLEGGGVLGAEVLQDIGALGVGIQVFIFGTVHGEQVVELVDEAADGRNELNKSLGNEHHAEVVALFGTAGHGVANLLHHIVEGQVLSLHLFRHDADIGLALQSALQSDMAGRTAHQFDEVPVFAGRVAVAFNIAYQLGIGLGGRVEAEARLYLVVLQVAVDGLGAAYHLHAAVLGSIILGQHTGVGVGVVAADDDDGLDVELAYNLETLLKLAFLLQLGAAASYHVETAGVAVFVYQFGSKFHIVVVHQSAGAQDEAIDAVFGVKTLHGVEKSANHVVAAGGLTAAENHAHIHLA